MQLNQRTIQSFDAYIRRAEAEADQEPHEHAPFLWSDLNSERAKHVREGQIMARFWAGKGPAKVASGLIHDWIAAAFIPESTIQEIFAVIQDYDDYKKIYKPEVIESKLASRHNNDFQIYLRLLKQKMITVVLDTVHEVHYQLVDRRRWVCRSCTTRIAEVENAGSRDERVLRPDTGYGFLWRLYSYWRFEERDAGVILECRAISLTRDVPFGLGWAIEPIIQKLPEESLLNTLEATRQAVHPRTR
ncbi:MAG TPA: hypothetical protein VHR84_10445 [Terriglobales bacterium]|jgi:hypothetical protein|nr:hypothetical protein [Terriglobales bacterium]